MSSEAILQSAPATHILLGRGSELLEVASEDGMFGLHVDEGTCFGFNASAYRVWQLIRQPTTLADLCKALTAEFDVSAKACEGDVRTIAAALVAEKLCTVRLR